MHNNAAMVAQSIVELENKMGPVTRAERRQLLMLSPPGPPRCKSVDDGWVCADGYVVWRTKGWSGGPHGTWTNDTDKPKPTRWRPIPPPPS